MKGRGWLVPAVGATVLTIVTLAMGWWELCHGRHIEAASWVMAAGGLGLVVFASVQLHRETQRENQRQAAEARHEDERLAAAVAKLRPVAWLARRMCEQSVIESGQQPMNQWMVRWYVSPRRRVAGEAGPNVIDVLQNLMRETVTLAAEVGGDAVLPADFAFESFISAANILNELYPVVVGSGLETTAYQAAIPRARKGANHLSAAAHELEALAPRGIEEPAVPRNPKFTDEK